MKFDIPNMYKFHKQKSVDVEVDLLRVYWNETEEENTEQAGSDNAKQDGSSDQDDVEEKEEESEGEEMPLGLCGHA